ncbi:hypothetical protein [Bacillus phage CP-51]|uniref:Uncharacterized protein n=1 Tax=Bacillus phage CP-51 TaxID=1391188 RepID=A0A068EMN0_9CAUD|nr:hypothetical protein OZ73_gp015 [Bacillus phage CP-51]AID50450.1 hypothetical protein [Bacillus phage CP-51]
MNDDTLLVISPKLMDIQKGKSDRNGLVQQILTYVRDGRTVTRKQWVRSEFADHAKKNEEEKKDTLLREKQREERREAKKNQEQAEKVATQDKRARKKKIKEKEKMEGHGGDTKHVIHVGEYAKKIQDQKKKRMQEEKDKKHKQQGDKKKDNKKKDKHSSFGQAKQTREDNKASDNMSLGK